VFEGAWRSPKQINIPSCVEHIWFK